MPYSEDQKEFIRRGVHRLFCSPGERCKDSKGQTRVRLLTDQAPERGSDDCWCKDQRLTVNGEVL